MPVVSVILPTHNRASYIGEAIESVLAQTFQDWELIIVDDGSTDHTKKLVDSYVQRDPRVHYIWQKNAYCVAARNNAFGRVRGKYVAFIDDDDRWLAKKLEIQVKAMEQDPEIGFCYMQFQIYKKTREGLQKTKLFPQFLARTFEELPDAFIAPCSVLFRKSHTDRLGKFDTRYKTCEDFDFWLRIAQICKIHPIAEVGAFTVMDGRLHDASNEIKVWQIGIEILRNLKLTPQYRHCKHLIRTHIAKRYYWIAREYLDQKVYWRAAAHFSKALLTDPLIGLAVRASEKQDVISQIVKSYAAAPLCLLKGLVHGRR